MSWVRRNTGTIKLCEARERRPCFEGLCAPDGAVPLTNMKNICITKNRDTSKDASTQLNPYLVYTLIYKTNDTPALAVRRRGILPGH